MRERVYAIDIESVSLGKISNDFTDNQSYALGNVKDPVKVEAKLKEKRYEASQKHGLSWWLGKICSVAIIDLHSDDAYVFHGHDEKEILSDLLGYIAVGGSVKLIGKNSLTFDFPFLVGRLMANDMKVPNCLKQRSKMLDVDTFFGFSSASGQRTKLDNYAFGLQLGGKILSGDKVQSVYDKALMARIEGDAKAENEAWKLITDYNLQDSEIVKRMALKYYGPEVSDINGY